MAQRKSKFPLRTATAGLRDISCDQVPLGKSAEKAHLGRKRAENWKLGTKNHRDPSRTVPIILLISFSGTNIRVFYLNHALKLPRKLRKVTPNAEKPKEIERNLMEDSSQSTMVWSPPESKKEAKKSRSSKSSKTLKKVLNNSSNIWDF